MFGQIYTCNHNSPREAVKDFGLNPLHFDCNPAGYSMKFGLFWIKFCMFIGN